MNDYDYLANFTNVPEDVAELFKPFADKMDEAHMPPVAINGFKNYFQQLALGLRGILREKDILPVKENELLAYGDLKKYAQHGENVVKKAVIIKLNGGLGTSMKLRTPKSLIPVKGNSSFLDIILEQAKIIREKTKTTIPFLFMDSFCTHEQCRDSLKKLENPHGLESGFLQHQFPKVLAETLTPAVWPKEPNLEWNPPGHGDIYLSLITSGLLSDLLRLGYKYAFISNVDNLNATLDTSILGYMDVENLPFVMEVSKRQIDDKKGGHLVRLLKSNNFALREIAQCLEDELDYFQDVKRHQFFNTNSIWVNLQVFEELFIGHKVIPLDLIANTKNLDPRDSSSPQVFQLEAAMGSAITNFYNAASLVVPRSRFLPVKTTSDLLLARSDRFSLTNDAVLQDDHPTLPRPNIILDEKYYTNIEDFEERFEHVPSLKDCTSLQIKGDIFFGSNVILEGDVRLINMSDGPVTVSFTSITGERIFK